MNHCSHSSMPRLRADVRPCAYRYFRHPKDLPWTGIQMQWHLHVRRFRCLSSDCHRKLFTERLPGLLHPSARRSNRFTEALSRLALALGGQAGARLGSYLRLCASPSILLRIIRRTITPVAANPRIVGISEPPGCCAGRRGWSHWPRPSTGNVICPPEKGT